ncbi:MAG: prepilin-type N-terminal cleavage/methylation domain-containing protein [Xanthomonadales bacterium]|nr:prepilin-type N-terminal cleavage/methylation domain-containing protein [Xanthomonadales bacterium]
MKAAYRQRGMSLMEMLIAMSISLVVSLAMVGLMANTLGTGTETIGSARLTSEIRAALQIMTRDLRRANYHANYIKCFGNLDCRDILNNGDGNVENYIKPITVTGGSCFFYWFDRDSDGDGTDDDPVGAFRRVVVGGVGVIQMTTTRENAPSCNSGNYWTAITDPDVINVTNFFVSNALSYTDTVDGATQTVDKIALVITAQLTGNAAVQRTVQDVIRVRNDIFAPAP